jgi:hypothetical protein
LEFDMSLRWPDESHDVSRPLVVILGGQKSGRSAADMVKDTRGAIVAALSYPYHVAPWPTGPAILLGLPKIHVALLDTPAAVMLALDYVERRAAGGEGLRYSSVDLVGVSLGVPFVCVAAALDQRFGRVWSIHGAGEPYKLLEHNLRKFFNVGPVRKVMTAIAHVVASGRALDPSRWVGRISPRPFVMINAVDDARIPRSYAMSLYHSAREPKELHWMEGDHVAIDREDVIDRLCQMIFMRVGGPTFSG